MNQRLALAAALRCLTCGLLAFLPVLGIPFALCAFHFHVRASGLAPDGWDVPRRYSRLGIFFAGISLILNVSAIAWVAIIWWEQQV
jgi:hypothetical protein